MLIPECVLDEYDGPRLFTVRSKDDHLLLAYQCAQTDDLERYLVVPVDDEIIKALDENRLTLREALTGRGVAWLVDRRKDGGVINLGAVEPKILPASALPAEGVCLGPVAEPLLRLRMVGDTLTSHQVPASVVRRAVDGATGALRTLVRHALRMRPITGRPAEALRRFYDLPAVGFAFGSFQIEFGPPSSEGQLMLEGKEALQTACELLKEGLQWVTRPESPELPQTPRSAAIVEALVQLAPKQKGVVSLVEVSGDLAGHPQTVFRLTRISSDRINHARKRLSIDRHVRTYEGFIREFDKDRLTFILRTATGETLRAVSFSEDQYEDALLAFDTERAVTIIVEDLQGTTADLVLVTSVTIEGPQGENDTSLEEKLSS